MANTSIRNILVDGAVTLPPPYNRILQSGDTVVIGDSVANVLANFQGGGATVSRCLEVKAALNSATPDIVAAGGTTDPKLAVFTNPAAASTTGVHAAVAESAANAFPGPFTNPAIPRNITATFAAGWQGGDITIVGTNQFDEVQTEVIPDTAGATVAGVKTFKTVTAASKETVAGAADAASLGWGVKMGLGVRMVSATGAVLFTDGAIEAATLDATNHSFTATTAPDGAHDYALLYNT